MEENINEIGWKKFIDKLLKRKRKKYSAKIPVDYLLALADEIHKSQPTRQIIYNTIKDIYSMAFEDGYEKRIEDRNCFIAKQEKHINDDWNKIKDAVDDEIHTKVN